MSQKIRIKLQSYDHNLVDRSAEKIVKTVKAQPKSKQLLRGILSAIAARLEEFEVWEIRLKLQNS